ncbi:TRAP transporter substrate-binding protein [Bacillus solitudinis]|uniref:TRAP transporter substrate-binding protein n=1 Tax=Bacillus solitudinis TaxID=2014074 RepID=UPI0012FE46E7|nr:TRAP transporter substrate-binding protein [Bacillus solitudinis]
MKKARVSLLIMMILMTLSLIGCGTNQGESPSSDMVSASQEDVHIFKIAHIGPESNIWTKVMVKFNEELVEQSDGRLSLELYPNAVLGNEPDLMLQMNTGSLDMAFITAAELTNRSSSFNAWFLPFLLEDTHTAKIMTETDEAKAILDSLSEDEGVHALGYTFIETRHILMRDSLVNDVDELRGKKIRVTPSPVIISWWESLGVAPTPIPLPDVYSALQTGVIDGIDIGPIGVMTSNLYESGKSLTKLNHMMFTGVSFVSEKIWNNLSNEDQKLIQAAFNVAKEYNFELSEELERESFAEFEVQNGKIGQIEDLQLIYEKAEEFNNKYSESDEKIKAFIEKAKEIRPN